MTVLAHHLTHPAVVGIEASAATPLHRLLGLVQHAEASGLTQFWVTGTQAPAVAARLGRLTRLTVGAQVSAPLLAGLDGAAEAARDAVSLLEISGGKAELGVQDPEAAARLQRQLDARPAATTHRFGGDFFTVSPARERTGRIGLTVTVRTARDLRSLAGQVSTIRVEAPTAAEAAHLVRSSRAARPGVSVIVAVPVGEDFTAWPAADGILLVGLAAVAEFESALAA